MEDLENLMSSMFGTMSNIKVTMEDIRKKQRINFAQWVTQMSLAYKIKPSGVIKQFYLSLEAIKDSISEDNIMTAKPKKGKKK